MLKIKSVTATVTVIKQMFIIHIINETLIIDIS